MSPFQTQYEYVKSRAEGILNELQLSYKYSDILSHISTEEEINSPIQPKEKNIFLVAFYNKQNQLMLEFSFSEFKILDDDFSLSTSMSQGEEIKKNTGNIMILDLIARTHNKTDFQNTTFKKESLDQSIKQNMDEFEQAAKTYLLPYLKGEVFVDHSPEILESYNEVTYNMQSELVFGKKKSLWQKISSFWRGN